VPHAGERLDAAGVAAEEPGLASGMAGGLLIAEGRRSDPGALAAAAAEEARAAGAEIRVHVEVKRLARGNVTPAAWMPRWSCWRRCVVSPLARMLRHELGTAGARVDRPRGPGARGAPARCLRGRVHGPGAAHRRRPGHPRGPRNRRARRARRARGARPWHPPERGWDGRRWCVPLGRPARGSGEPRGTARERPPACAMVPGIAGRRWPRRGRPATLLARRASLHRPARRRRLVCAGHGSGHPHRRGVWPPRRRARPGPGAVHRPHAVPPDR
jgi:hypothetical protein